MKPRNRLIVVWKAAAKRAPDATSLTRFATRALNRTKRHRLKTAKSARVMSHDGITFAEKESKRKTRAGTPGRRKRFYGVAFYCPQQSRRFLIMANDRQQTLVREALSHFRCH